MAKIGSLLLLGAAAFGAYKISKMSDEQRKDLLNKGKKLVNDNLGNLKNVRSKSDGQSALSI